MEATKQDPAAEDRSFDMTHSELEVRRHLLALGVFVLFLGCQVIWLASSGLKCSSDAHALIEMVGACVAAVAGLGMITRFRTLGDRFFLFVGMAFLVAGAGDFVHGLLSFETVHSTQSLPDSLEQAVPGTYVVGRLLLACLLLFAPIAQRLLGSSSNPEAETRWASLAVIAIGVLATAVTFVLPSLPALMRPERFISRPVDMLPALLLAAALALFLRTYARQRDMLVWWISLSIGVGMAGQLLMSFSHELFDAPFGAAHVYKVLGYLVVLPGLSFCQGRTIGSLKRAEEALSRANLELGQVFDATIPLCVVGTDRQLLRANQSFRTQFGLTPEALQGSRCDEVLSYGLCETAHCPLEALGRGEAARCEEEIELSTKNGKQVNCMMIATPLRDGRGEIVGIAESFMDVSGLMRAETERLQLITELEQKNTELEQYTYTVSHDLKSPMITITGFLAALEEDLAAGDTEQMKEDLQWVTDAAKKMVQLIEDLLRLSRVGRIVNAPESVPLVELAYEVKSMLSADIEQRGVQVEISDDLPAVFGDRVRLREVLQNLVENAIKFMGDQSQPRIEIGVRQEEDEQVCFVRDNGIGIEPKHHETVFGMFKKLDLSTKGTGVGMAISKRIVEVLGGRIWVESDGRAQGASFCFVLPTLPPE